MIIAAAFMLMICTPGANANCHPLPDTDKFDNRADCQAQADYLREFWQQNFGNQPPLPVRCDNEDAKA